MPGGALCPAHRVLLLLLQKRAQHQRQIRDKPDQSISRVWLSSDAELPLPSSGPTVRIGEMGSAVHIFHRIWDLLTDSV